MSHIATVDVVIKDLQSLERACKRLGLEFKTNQKTFKWYGRWMNDYNAQDAAYKHGFQPEDYGKCEHAIGVPGNSKAYEVGVVRKDDGTYALLWDFFAGGYGLMEAIGSEQNPKGAGKLLQAYAIECAKKSAKKEGWNVKEVRGENGQIKLQLSR
jgi:hypothetical protein